jgi:glycosyltransferase involved in cell wall biosynthesis
VSAPPRAAIGMPVFNLERTVARAIESVLGQTCGDFELVISDNTSTDGTEAICRNFAARDARIRYVRQPATLDVITNYRFVLDEASAPCFMWLAADDYVRPCLLAKALAVLETRPDVVCAAPRVEFLDADGSRRPVLGTAPLLGTTRENLCEFLRDPLDNSRFYGLYRRDVLRRVFPAWAYYGFDWTVAAGSLLYGKHEQLDEVLLVRETTEPAQYMRMIDRLPGRLGRLVPLATFTRAMLTELRVPRHPKLLWALLRINALHHVLYARHRYPRYGNLAYRLALVAKRWGG